MREKGRKEENRKVASVSPKGFSPFFPGTIRVY